MLSYAILLSTLARFVAGAPGGTCPPCRQCQKADGSLSSSDLSLSNYTTPSSCTSVCGLGGLLESQSVCLPVCSNLDSSSRCTTPCAPACPASITSLALTMSALANKHSVLLARVPNLALGMGTTDENYLGGTSLSPGIGRLTGEQCSFETTDGSNISIPMNNFTMVASLLASSLNGNIPSDFKSFNLGNCTSYYSPTNFAFVGGSRVFMVTGANCTISTETFEIKHVLFELIGNNDLFNNQTQLSILETDVNTSSFTSTFTSTEKTTTNRPDVAASTNTATNTGTYNATNSAANTGIYTTTNTATYSGTYTATYTGIYAADNATYTGIYTATDNATYTGHYTATDNGTYTATDNTTYTGIYTATDNATYIGHYTATDNGTYTGIYTATDNTTYTGVYTATDNATYTGIYTATDNTTYTGIYTATDNATYTGIYTATDNATYTGIYTATDNATYTGTATASAFSSSTGNTASSTLVLRKRSPNEFKNNNYKMEKVIKSARVTCNSMSKINFNKIDNLNPTGSGEFLFPSFNTTSLLDNLPPAGLPLSVITSNTLLLGIGTISGRKCSVNGRSVDFNLTAIMSNTLYTGSTDSQKKFNISCSSGINSANVNRMGFHTGDNCTLTGASYSLKGFTFVGTSVLPITEQSANLSTESELIVVCADTTKIYVSAIPNVPTFLPSSLDSNLFNWGDAKTLEPNSKLSGIAIIKGQGCSVKNSDSGSILVSQSQSMDIPMVFGQSSLVNGTVGDFSSFTIQCYQPQAQINLGVYSYLGFACNLITSGFSISNISAVSAASIGVIAPGYYNQFGGYSLDYQCSSPVKFVTDFNANIYKLFYNTESFFPALDVISIMDQTYKHQKMIETHSARGFNCNLRAAGGDHHVEVVAMEFEGSLNYTSQSSELTTSSLSFSNCESSGLVGAQYGYSYGYRCLLQLGESSVRNATFFALMAGISGSPISLSNSPFNLTCNDSPLVVQPAVPRTELPNFPMVTAVADIGATSCSFAVGNSNGVEPFSFSGRSAIFNGTLQLLDNNFNYLGSNLNYFQVTCDGDFFMNSAIPSTVTFTGGICNFSKDNQTSILLAGINLLASQATTWQNSIESITNLTVTCASGEVLRSKTLPTTFAKRDIIIDPSSLPIPSNFPVTGFLPTDDEVQLPSGLVGIPEYVDLSSLIPKWSSNFSSAIQNLANSPQTGIRGFMEYLFSLNMFGLPPPPTQLVLDYFFGNPCNETSSNQCSDEQCVPFCADILPEYLDIERVIEDAQKTYSAVISIPTGVVDITWYGTATKNVTAKATGTLFGSAIASPTRPLSAATKVSTTPLLGLIFLALAQL